MGRPVLRGRISRQARRPDIFISHSHQDKEAARNLAIDLALVGIDAWLDEWEIHAGESLHSVIPEAIESCSVVGVLVTPNFAKSPWTKGELHQALASEKSYDSIKVLPLIFAEHFLPEIADKMHIDMRQPDYYRGLFRIAATLRRVPLDRISACSAGVPQSSGSSRIFSVVERLFKCGINFRVLLSKEDYDYLYTLSEKPASGWGSAITVDISRVPADEDLSPTLQAMAKRLPHGWREAIVRLFEMVEPSVAASPEAEKSESIATDVSQQFTWQKFVSGYE